MSGSSFLRHSTLSRDNRKNLLLRGCSALTFYHLLALASGSACFVMATITFCSRDFLCSLYPPDTRIIQEAPIDGNFHEQCRPLTKKATIFKERLKLKCKQSTIQD